MGLLEVQVFCKSRELFVALPVETVASLPQVLLGEKNFVKIPSDIVLSIMEGPLLLSVFRAQSNILTGKISVEEGSEERLFVKDAVGEYPWNLPTRIFRGMSARTRFDGISVVFCK